MAKQSALRDDGSTALWRRIRSRVLTRDQHTCQRCGLEATHVDHIIPRRLGGDDSMDNLQALCKQCNLSKGGGFFESVRTPMTPRLNYIVCTTLEGYPSNHLLLSALVLHDLHA